MHVLKIKQIVLEKLQKVAGFWEIDVSICYIYFQGSAMGDWRDGLYCFACVFKRRVGDLDRSITWFYPARLTTTSRLVEFMYMYTLNK